MQLRPGIAGLNRTAPVLNGIRHHSPEHGNVSVSQEALVAHLADDITYVNHDYDDLVESGILLTDADELQTWLEDLGPTYEERYETLLADVVETSRSLGEVGLSEDRRAILTNIKQYFKLKVIANSVFHYKDEEAEHIITRLFHVYTHGDLKVIHRYCPAREDFLQNLQNNRVETSINHIAGMTDTYALDQYQKILSPRVVEYEF